MPTQVQIRGAANATQQARTLASRELDVDTTNKRLAVHDGSTLGGIEHANFIDVQNNRFTYADAAGTNSITATYAPAPSARAKGQEWTFKAANTISGAATFNPNSLGAGTIYKIDNTGVAITAVGANEIIQNGFYTVIDIDGSTGYLLKDSRGGGLTTVKQGDLSTLQGSVSVSGGTSLLTLPGGEYGFYPQIRVTPQAAGGNGSASLIGVPTSSTNNSLPSNVSIGGTYLSRIHLGPNTSGLVMAAQQRYVTASPPFDIGDGEMGGFHYLLLNADRSIAAAYHADVPPWAYNGPTDIRATRICPHTRQKFIRRVKRPSLDAIMDGAALEYEEVPLTQTIKNADMKLIPHPFGSVEPGQTVVLLDPMDMRTKRLLDYQDAGGDLVEFMQKVKPDNESLKRKQIKGVRQVSFKL